MFFFNIREDGTPFPNYCDDADGSDACQRCAVAALKQLIAETQERLNNPLLPARRCTARLRAHTRA